MPFQTLKLVAILPLFVSLVWPRASISIGTRQLTRSGIDRDIYGATLEHMGQQMDTLRAELLQDKSFEGFRDFSKNTESWAEGKVNNQAFWWHSGYELHPWRSFGATVETTSGSNFMNGSHGKLIVHNDGPAAGIAQDGIPLKAGMKYRFEGYFDPAPYPLRKPGSTASVTIGLYADSGRGRPYCTATLAVNTAGFHEYSADLTVPEKAENATFAISLAGNARLAVDLVSLKPADNIDGWRRDAVAAIRDMGITSFRYPGGIFASFLDWRTMVGARETRAPFTNPYWGGLENNDVGTDEFLRLMELVHGNAMICVNMLTGTPELAAGWVEYCNGAATTHYGRMRARNGHPKPYGVKFWELDNEVQRRFTAVQYGELCRRYGDAMKAVDPNIKLMAVSYFWRDEPTTLPQMLERAAASIDFLALRSVDEDDFSRYRAFADRFSTPAHRLHLASTEWRSRFRKDIWIPLRIDGSLRKVNASWGYALEGGRTFQEFQRRADDVRLAMYPSITNLYGEDLMQVSKSSILYTASGQVFKLMSDIRGQVVESTVSGAAQEKLDVNAVVDKAAGRLVCTLVHGSGNPLPARLDLSAWKGVRTASITSLSSDNIANRVDFSTPDSVTRIERKMTASNGIFQIDLKGYSITKAVFLLP